MHLSLGHAWRKQALDTGLCTSRYSLLRIGQLGKRVNSIYSHSICRNCRVRLLEM